MASPASLFTAWQNFYILAGSAAGALTGLQFVIITLITQLRATGDVRNIHAFGTPTVVHFCTALFLSAVMEVPWQQFAGCKTCLYLYGGCGLVYATRVVSHARKAEYQPDLEDWLWYTISPILAYIVLLVAAASFSFDAAWAFSLTAADCLAFLALGIHNAWDTVTYIAIRHGGTSQDAKEKKAEL